MKKIELGQAITILANVGVIAGIAFLALEIQQNTNAIRGTTIQAISDQSYDISIRMVENADLRAARRAARDNTLSEDQTDQLNSFYSALMKIQQNRFRQVQLGTVEEEAIFQAGGQGAAYRTRFFAEYWTENKNVYPLDFQQFIEQEVLPLSPRIE